MLIAIIHNINTLGRSCIRLLHQIALQYTTQLSTENYTRSTVKHFKDKQIVHIMAMGARNLFGFMGSISDQHLMLIQKQLQGAKHFQWTLPTVILLCRQLHGCSLTKHVFRANHYRRAYAKTLIWHIYFLDVATPGRENPYRMCQLLAILLLQLIWSFLLIGLRKYVWISGMHAYKIPTVVASNIRYTKQRVFNCVPH